MNYINIVQLQQSEYSSLLSDFQRFRGKVNKIMDQLEQQLQEYIQQSILNKTYSQKVYTNIEKEFNLDLIISNFYQHVKGIENNKVYTEFALDKSMGVFNVEYNKIYEKTLLSIKENLSPNIPILTGIHGELKYEAGALSRKYKGDARWYFGTFKSLVNGNELSTIRLNIINGGCIVVGMCESGRLEKTQYEWKGRGNGLYVATQNGYSHTNTQGEDVDFIYKTGDIIYCTHSLKSSNLTIENISKGQTIEYKLDNQINYEFCVGLRYQTDKVQII